jgi:hypothetical protein
MKSNSSWNTDVASELNQKKKLHLLNEENYISTSWKYFGSYFYISLNSKDDLKNHKPSQISFLSKAFFGIHHNRASLNSFTLSQLLSNNFWNQIRIGTHTYVSTKWYSIAT